MIFTSVCESCIHKKKLSRKRVKGAYGSMISKLFVKCKRRGTVEAPIERRKITRKRLCKDYTQEGYTWELDTSKWIWSRKDAVDNNTNLNFIGE